jgi:hypothetical protein
MVMNRSTYHREYYQRTRARRLYLKSMREQRTVWLQWLADQLGVSVVLKRSYSAAKAKSLARQQIRDERPMLVDGHRNKHRDNCGNSWNHPRSLRARLLGCSFTRHCVRLQAAHQDSARVVRLCRGERVETERLCGVPERQTREDRALPGPRPF